MTSPCFTTKGNKCSTFYGGGECFHADGDKYACPVEIAYGGGYAWEECSPDCSKECLPGQWKCHKKCIDQSQPCKGVCKPSNIFFLEVSTALGLSN